MNPHAFQKHTHPIESHRALNRCQSVTSQTPRRPRRRPRATARSHRRSGRARWPPLPPPPHAGACRAPAADDLSDSVWSSGAWRTSGTGARGPDQLARARCARAAADCSSSSTPWRSTDIVARRRHRQPRQRHHRSFAWPRVQMTALSSKAGTQSERHRRVGVALSDDDGVAVAAAVDAPVPAPAAAADWRPTCAVSRHGGEGDGNGRQRRQRWLC